MATKKKVTTHIHKEGKGMIQATSADEKAPASDKSKVYALTMRFSFPEPNGWLRVTSAKTERDVYVPLPIRLIQVIPPEGDNPGGCLIRGAHGDEALSKEGIIEILNRLNGYALGGAHEWALAT